MFKNAYFFTFNDCKINNDLNLKKKPYIILELNT